MAEIDRLGLTESSESALEESVLQSMIQEEFAGRGDILAVD